MTKEQISDALDTVQIAIDKIAEATDMLRELAEYSSQLKYYILPSLNDVIEGPDRNPYNASLFDILKELEEAEEGDDADADDDNPETFFDTVPMEAA